MTQQKVFQQIEKDRQWILDILFEYLRIPSISAQNKGVKETVSFLEKLFSSLNLKARIMETKGNPVVFASINRGAKRSILFYNHYDVQPPEPLEEWQSPPFEPSIRDGKVFARGVADNKANLITRIAAVKAIYDVAGKLPVDVKFFVEGEEEIGSPNLASVVKKYKGEVVSDLCIWEASSRDEEGHPQILLGCKGIVCGELECTTALKDNHSSRAAILPNPAWRLVWALASIKNKYEKILIRNFYDRIRKASLEEKELLKKIPFDKNKIKKSTGVKKFIKELPAEKLREQYFYGTSFNICGFKSGYIYEGHKTVLPKTAFVKFDIRLVPDMEPRDIIAKLRRHLKEEGFNDIKIKNIHGYPPASTSPANPYVKLVVESGKGIWDKDFVIIPWMAGSGPMYLFSRIMPCIGLGVENAFSNIHAPNEQVYLEDIFIGTKHIANLLLKMADV